MTAPITDALVRFALAHDCRCTHRTLVVAVQHVVPDALDLFGGLIGLGVPPDNILLAGKWYSTVAATARALQRRGVFVLPSRRPEFGRFYEAFVADVDDLWQLACRRLDRQPDLEEILVLDDAGKALTRAPLHRLRSVRVVGQEQTTSGLRELAATRVPFAVIAEGAAAVKRRFESPLFVQAALGRTLRRVGDVAGLHCGVIGLGPIGRTLVHELQCRGATVSVHDHAAGASIPRGARRRAASQLFADSDLVFGCTGQDVTAGLPWPPRHRDGARWLSLSTGDREFGSLLREIATRRGSDDDIRIANSTGDATVLTPSGTLRVLAAGHPFNFDRRTGSASRRHMQLTVGMLLGGAIQGLRLSRRAAAPTPSGLVMSSPALQAWALRTWLQLDPELPRRLHLGDQLRPRASTWLAAHSGGDEIADPEFTAWFADTVS